MKTITVKTALRKYSIILEKGIFDTSHILIKKYVPGFNKFVFITNKNIFSIFEKQINIFCKKLKTTYDIVCLGDGEKYKNLESAKTVYSRMIKSNFHRNDAIIAFGGGVIGDTAGFISATFHRGMKLIHIPTTIIGQVDSSIGGKVVVNYESKKNIIGSFYQPHLILMDPFLLESLDKKQVINGLGEVVKYGLVFDRKILNTLNNIIGKENVKTENIVRHKSFSDLIYTCACLKARVVEKDEFDLGYRNLLNFGHTIGHSIENVSGLKDISHGEAVSMGMIAALELSVALGYFPKKDKEKIKLLFKKFRLPTKIPLENADEVFKNLKHDKKFTADTSKFVLLRGINHPFFLKNIKKDIIVNSINNCIDK